MGLIIEMVENHIDEVLAELEQAKKQALEAVGLQAEGYAQMYAPVDTGRLRNSISERHYGLLLWNRITEVSEDWGVTSVRLRQ